VSIIVDTSVWSAALRRPVGTESNEARELGALITEGRAILLGPVRQELLSGIKSPERFKALRAALRAFPEFRLRTRDYEEAASCFNRCRAQGLQGSNTDFLLCATALERGLAIYTTDKDFDGFARVLRMKLHRARARD
jgi:predicted nucleic acid-binding protein